MHASKDQLMNPRRWQIACAAIALALLWGCGQKGPLYLPDKKGTSVAKPVAPSPGLRGSIEAKIAARPRAAVKRAVLVVDMIEDYLTPGRPLFVQRAPAIVPSCAVALAQSTSTRVMRGGAISPAVARATAHRIEIAATDATRHMPPASGLKPRTSSLRNLKPFVSRRHCFAKYRQGRWPIPTRDVNNV